MIDLTYHLKDKIRKKLSRKYSGDELEYKIKQKLYQKGYFEWYNDSRRECEKEIMVINYTSCYHTWCSYLFCFYKGG